MDEADAVNVTEKIGAKCFVEASGKVNCSHIIYEDERSWRKSRNQIDLLIHVLKGKIAELKGIKKHLKHNKPTGVNDEEEDDSSSDENFSKEHSHHSTSKRPLLHVSKKPSKEQDLKSFSTTSASEVFKTRTQINDVIDTEWSSQAKTVTTPLIPSAPVNTTRSPLGIPNRTTHRTRGHQNGHRSHHNVTRNSGAGWRRTTPMYSENTTLTHRRNGSRPIKYNSTTRRMHVSTTPATTSLPEGILQTIPDVTTAPIDTLTISSVVGGHNDMTSMTTAGPFESFSVYPSTQAPRFEKGSSTHTEEHSKSSITSESSYISTQRSTSEEPEKTDEETDESGARTECFCEQDSDE